MSEAVASDFTGPAPTGPEVAAEPAAEMPQAPAPGEGGAPEAGGTPDVPPQMDDPGDVDISGMMEGNEVAPPPPVDTPVDGQPVADQGVQASEGEQPGGDPNQQGSVTPGTFAEFTLPDGYRMLEGAEGSHFIKHAAEHGLTQEQAQAQIDFDAQRAQRLSEQFQSQRKVQAQALRQERMEQMRNDPDVGGTATKLKESIGHFNSAVQELGGQELHNFLMKTGLAFEPLIVKTFARAHQALGESKTLGASRPAASERSVEERLLGIGLN